MDEVLHHLSVRESICEALSDSLHHEREQWPIGRPNKLISGENRALVGLDFTLARVVITRGAGDHQLEFNRIFEKRMSI